MESIWRNVQRGFSGIPENIRYFNFPLREKKSLSCTVYHYMKSDAAELPRDERNPEIPFNLL